MARCVIAAWYNEIDEFAAQWLRNLITAGHIADGVVDTRSVSDVSPDDIKDFKQCHFFAGIGVWGLALSTAGWPDDRPVWTGSCPCTPFSVAGRSAGFADERHLWPHWHHLIRECRPRVIFGEQVASGAGLKWFDLVHADLEAEGYAVGAVDLCAAGVGAPHIRQRLFWVASDTMCVGVEGRSQAGGSCEMRQRRESGALDMLALLDRPFDAGDRHPKPLIRRLDDDVPGRVGRLRAYGNAIVPPLAAEFIGAFMEAA